MKKIVLTMTLIAGVVAGAMVLTAFTENDSNTIVATEGEMGGDCSFEVTNVSPSISGTTVTITVSVEPTFTPQKGGSYEVVVKPKGSLRNILDSQSKSVTFVYKSNSWSTRTKTVQFYCSVNDNSYNQCNSNDFYVSSCFEK